MQTQRIYLQPFDLENDVEFHIQLMNTPNWLKFVGDRNIHTPEDFLSFYELRMKNNAEKGYLNFVIYDQKTRNKMGTCGIYKRNELQFADIGYALLPAYEGNAYLQEAAPLVMDYFFKTFPDQEILSAFTGTDHIASQKILEKLGFTKIDERMIPPYEDSNSYYEIHKTL